MDNALQYARAVSASSELMRSSSPIVDLQTPSAVDRYRFTFGAVSFIWALLIVTLEIVLSLVGPQYAIGTGAVLAFTAIVIQLRRVGATSSGPVLLFALTMSVFIWARPIIALHSSDFDLRMIEVLTGITVTEAGLNIYFATVVASLVAFSATVLAFQFSIPAARSLEPQTVDRAFAGSARFTWRMLFVIGAIASLTQSVLYIRYFLSGASYYDLYVTGTDTVGPPGLSFLASLLFYGYLGLLVVSANDTSRREHRLRLASTFVFVVVSLVGLTRGSRGEVFTELLVGLWMYSFTGGKSILVRHWLIYGVGLLGLSQVVGALRSGDAIFAGETQIVKIGEWFVYSQGVSGELVAPASTEFGVNPENVRFLLSPLLTPFRRVFDPSFGAQTAQTGQSSGLLAHELAFRVAPEAYLAGRGAGSSYLAECYCSLGIFGVILATAALTWIVLHGPHLFSRSRAALFIFAASLPYILFVPRESLMLPVIPVLKATVLLLICRRLGTLYVYYRRHSNV